MTDWSPEEIHALETALFRYAVFGDRVALDWFANAVFDRAEDPLLAYFRRHGATPADAEDLAQAVLAEFCSTETLRGIAMAIELARSPSESWLELMDWQRRVRVSATEVFGYWLGYLAKSARRAFRRAATRDEEQRQARLDAFQRAFKQALLSRDESDLLDAAEAAGLGQGIPDILRAEAEVSTGDDDRERAELARHQIELLRRMCAQLDVLLRQHLDARTYEIARLAYVDDLDSREIAKALWGEEGTTSAARARKALSRGYQNQSLEAARRAWAAQLSADEQQLLARMVQAAESTDPSAVFQAQLLAWGRANRWLPD